jgi:hypothetical protein
MAAPPDTGQTAHPGVCLCIGLTAHRDLLPAQEPALRAAVRGFFQDLRARFPDLPLRLISALAEGGDQLVAEEALALGVDLVVPLPMPQAEYERDFASAPALAHFRELLARGRVRVLPLAPGLRAEDIAVRGEQRDRQYAQLGMFISSHCQVLLALWDGRPSEATGGTAQVVEFHLRNLMPSLDVSQVAPNLLADDESDLVYHLPCARRSAGVPVAEPGEPRWLTLAGSHPVGPGLPGHYGHVFGQMQTLNRDIARHAAAVEADASVLFDASVPGPVPPLAAGVERLFRAADCLALHFQSRVRSSLRWTHALAALMGLSFILFSDVRASRVFVLAFLVLFGVGLLLTLVGRRREWQRKYLDYRGLAEGLRVQLYWRMAAGETPPNSSLGYDSFLQKQDVDLSWIRHAMRGTGLLRDEAFGADPGWLAWVAAHWIGDRDGVGGQLQYYREGTRRRERAYRWTTRLGDLALAGGLLGALILLLADADWVARMQQPLLLAMGLLPLLAGIREAYSYKKADKELIKQFRFMSRLFDSCSERLRVARTEAATRQLLLALGRACLEEHAEWILLHRERPLEHSQLAG